MNGGVKGDVIVSYTVKEGDNIGAWVGGVAKQTGEKTGEVRNGGATQLLLDGQQLPSVIVESLPSGW